jgi:hypothetical protein
MDKAKTTTFHKNNKPPQNPTIALLYRVLLKTKPKLHLVTAILSLEQNKQPRKLRMPKNG